MPELPWVKWFPSDWSSEPGLAMCDALTRGIWFECINSMFLSGKCFIQGTEEELCRLLRCRSTQLQLAMSELSKFDVAIVESTNCQQTVNISLTNRRRRRELEISSLRSKAGVVSSTKRQHTHQQTPQHPSAYAYASASASTPKEGVQGEESNGTLDSVFVRDLLSTYRRPAHSRLTHLEESTLAEIIREHPRYRDEWDIIVTLKKKEPRYFPQSLSRLLSSWQETLDRANSWVPIPDGKPVKPSLMERIINELPG